MKRVVLGMMVVALAVGLAGCSGDGLGGGTSYRELIIGTWRLREQRDPGETTFTPVSESNTYAVTFNENFTWIDSTGDTGDWQLSNRRLLTYSNSPGDPDAFGVMLFYASNRRFEIDYYEDDSFAQANGHASRYYRTN